MRFAAHHSPNRLSQILLEPSDPHAIFVQRVIDFLLRPADPDARDADSPLAAFNLALQRRQQAARALPFFQAQHDHLIAEIKSAMRPRHPLLVEGGPGIGKGTALLSLVQSQALLRPAVYIRLDDVLPSLAGAARAASDDFHDASDSLAGFPLSSSQDAISDGPMSQSLLAAEAWRSALETAFGLDFVRQEQLYDPDGSPLDMTAVGFEHITDALRHIRAKSRYGPTLVVIDNLQLLFDEREPIAEIYSAFYTSFRWLLKCENEGILDIIFCSSSKSVMPAMRRFHGYDKRLRYRSIESVDDLDVIDYILDQVNPTLPEARQFTEETAHTFVQTFDGNLVELTNYCSSELSVQDYIRRREEAFLEYLKHHIPTRPASKRPSVNPYAPPVSEETDFKDIILEMIMRNGVLSLAQVDTERLALIEVLVEKNFLRWRDARVRRRERAQPTRRRGTSIDTRSEFSSDTMDDTTSFGGGAAAAGAALSEHDKMLQEEQMNDPLAFLSRGDTELVWYNRLVGSVCERWFNDQAW
ncbi:hypothetical protein HK105_200943 [Polyrhizophydium stewartii]|uniref:Orc1-like AAA ATPase domain-containing protein n=1 Tax=Polyrhizophydium stewartii TaxID=2732419 RepID=A0ABR4NIF1_9FUNG